MRWTYLTVMVLLFTTVKAQHDPVSADTAHQEKATTLLQAFKKGRTSGHFRYFFMGTENLGKLTDYYANAVGGGLKYETAPLHNIQVGISGFYIFNIGSSDLSKADPLTNQYNRYELSLFDLEDPHNKEDIDRLEELYIKYHTDRMTLTFGKQLVNTPFLNPQDSRMRPTEVEGFFGTIKLNQQWDLESGWIYRISPRSTVKWYSIPESMGVSSMGVNSDGTPGNYSEHVESKGIGLLGANYKPSESLRFKLYDQFSENMFNTAMIQADLSMQPGTSKLLASLQYIRQDVINNGGHENPSLTYFDKNNKVNILGARLGMENHGFHTSLNYTRIFKGGRFTLPREWGTEPLFTYLPRERNEGLGNVNAVMAKVEKNILKDHLKLEGGYGRYYLPSVSDAEHNKYGMPSYQHIMVKGDYKFGGFLEGLDMAVLLVYKDQIGSRIEDPKYVFNKVDMLSYNLIANYHF